MMPRLSTLMKVGLGTLLGLGLTGQVFAAPIVTSSADHPAPLVSAVQGSLVGSNAGAYNYYVVDYPGQYAIGTLSLNFGPADPTISNAVGITVWQNGTQISSVDGTGASDPGSISVPFSSDQAGPVVVQVYNYDPNQKVSYDLSLTGLPESAAVPASVAPAVSVAPAPAPKSSAASTAAKTPDLSTPKTGTLVGSVAGAYADYSLNYPGDASVKVINFSFSPTGPDVANGVFVNVYQNGTLLSSYPGTENGSADPGNVQVMFSSTTAGPVLVQVANYNNNIPITYWISQ